MRPAPSTCNSLISTACLVTVIGCSGGPDASHEECPEPGSFTFALEWDPVPGSSTSTSSGTVVGVLEDPPGTLSISVDLLSGDHAPGIHDFGVPLPEGAGIDLSVDDEVTVSTHDLTACLGCSIRELSIERDGEVVLYALECENEICNESDFAVGPLQFSTVTGRCEPWRDPDDDSWCHIMEHGGLEVGCAGGTVQELFRGQQTTVDCGEVYHVSAGFLTRVVEDRHTCADYPEDLRQILVIRER
jgi:hypothetical protein